MDQSLSSSPRPHPSDLVAAPRDRKTARSLIPNGARARHFVFHPPRILSHSVYYNIIYQYISVLSAQKCSGADMLATLSGVSRAASSAVPCRCTVHCSDYTRGQSRETGSFSRPFSSMEATTKCVTMGPADCRKRLQNPVRFSTASIERGYSHSGGPRACSGNGTSSRHSLDEGGH